LTGQTVKTTRDLARIGQVYRDPRIETLRIIYLDKDSNIVAHHGITSRLPGASAGFASKTGTANVARELFNMRQRMKRMGADSYYLLHNHPSGDPIPSSQDAALTRKYEANVPGFKGHVVIDSVEYSVLYPRSAADREGIVRAETFTLDPKIDDRLL